MTPPHGQHPRVEGAFGAGGGAGGVRVPVVVFASVKGAPGVTTTALAVAATWPAPAVPVLVEADPHGGDLAVRYRLPDQPGLVTLAAAARRDTRPGLLTRHTQTLPGGLLAVPAPSSAEHTAAALSVLAASPARTTGALWADAGDLVVILDGGRISPTLLAPPPLPPSSPAVPGPSLAQTPDEPPPTTGPVWQDVVDLLVLVTTDDDPGLVHTADAISAVARAEYARMVDALNGAGHVGADIDAGTDGRRVRESTRRAVRRRVRVVTVGHTRDPREVEAALGVQVTALPIDPAGAALLNGATASRRNALTRSALVRAGTHLAHSLASTLAAELAADLPDAADLPGATSRDLRLGDPDESGPADPGGEDERTGWLPTGPVPTRQQRWPRPGPAFDDPTPVRDTAPALQAPRTSQPLPSGPPARTWPPLERGVS